MTHSLTTFVSVLGVVACAAGARMGARAQERTTKVDIAQNGIGVPPADFEFARTGEGELGRWLVVRDPTAIAGVAIEHVSTDQHDDRFPLAIYKPIRSENVAISARFKIISGTLKSAGVAIGLRNPDSYYAISASALEHRIDVLLFAQAKIAHIGSADAEVELNRWHALQVRVDDDHFTVALDDKVLLTTFDRTRMKDGRVALWTQEDNVTRFDQIEITPLASPEAH